jgi:hypothetical protein
MPAQYVPGMPYYPDHSAFSGKMNSLKDKHAFEIFSAGYMGGTPPTTALTVGVMVFDPQ